jgi:hypothetical protein
MPGMPGCFLGSLGGASHDALEGFAGVPLEAGGLSV